MTSAAAAALPAPAVSVVIPAYLSHETIACCLSGLDAQTFREFEVIVVDSSPDGRTAALVERWPRVRLVRSGARLLPHAARNEGIRRARGRLLVSLDPDCRPLPGWLVHLIGPIDETHPVSSGAIECAEHDWVSRGVHLCKFAPLLPGGPPGTRPYLAPANQAWLRETWENHGPFRGEAWAGDTELDWRIRLSGHGLRFEPDAVVVHTHRTTLALFLRERATRGEDFARMRAAFGKWSSLRLGTYLAAMPLEPAIMLVRTLRAAARAGRLMDALITSPVVVLGHLAWTWGEARGMMRQLGE